ncbi:MAG: aminoacyl-tRNA hydrolase [Candidatus Shapirobacteria bacterium]|nr:aminoacyl-tRNA hydrolase [Candidatus Shapirobacteria bacterium]
MLVVVGLGNSEKKYQNTRHNFGFLVLDQLLLQIFPQQNWKNNPRTGCLEAQRKNFLLAKPQAFMNSSGPVVKSLLNFYKIDSNNLLIVHDDLDLQFGQIKISKNQGPAGHRGVESVVEALGTKNFWRVRIGIGRSLFADNSDQVVKFVLADFSQEEKKNLSEIIKKTAELLIRLLEEEPEKIEGKYNILGRTKKSGNLPTSIRY